MKLKIFFKIFLGSILVVILTLLGSLAWHFYVHPLYVATLQVETQPARVEVTVDGKKFLSPLVLYPLSFGWHKIVVSGENFRTQEKMVFLYPFQRVSLEFKLDEPTAFLVVNSTPSAVKVFLNGKYIGEAPIDRFPITAGEELTLTCLKEGYQKFEKRFKAGLGSEEVIACKLAPEKITFSSGGSLYSANIDGSDKKALLQDGSVNLESFWVADKKRLLFLKTETQKKNVKGTEKEVRANFAYLMDAEGGGKSEKVIDLPVSKVLFSANRLLAVLLEATFREENFRYESGNKLWLADFQKGLPAGELMTLGPGDKNFYFSLDGKYLAVVYSSKLEVIKISEKKKVFSATFPEVVLASGERIPRVLWSFDSRFLIYNPLFLSSALSNKKYPKELLSQYKDGHINYYRYFLSKKEPELLFVSKVGYFPDLSPLVLSQDQQFIIYKGVRKDKLLKPLNELTPKDFVFLLREIATGEERVVLPEIDPEGNILDLVVFQNKAYILVNTQKEVSLYAFDFATFKTAKLAELSILAKGAKIYLGPAGDIYLAISKEELGEINISLYKVDESLKLLFDKLSVYPDILF